jgi:hypothetical protein
MRVACALVLVLFGCGSDDADEPSRARDRPAVSSDPLARQVDRSPAEKSPFPEGTRSLEMQRTVGVRLEPGDDAKRIGTIAVDTRIGWTRTAGGQGCQKPWVEIEPRGWVCSDYMKPSTKRPYGREVPILDRGELVPGVYGKVTQPNAVTLVLEKPAKTKTKARKPAPGPVTSTTEVAEPAEPTLVEGKPLVGSVNVRQYGELAVAGKTYWRISKKDPEYLPSQAIRTHKPSVWGGTRLGDETGWTLPIAFVWPRVRGWQQAATMYKPGAGVMRQLRARTAIQILETATDKAGKPTHYRIGEHEWMAAADVRVFPAAPPPPHLYKGERWIDVDLDTQILVAYEGKLPVYATMISSGSREHPTETGIYRMWLKESESDMKGLGGEDPYSVATVPWTQFYSPENGLALHTAYWHDGFGTPRSHGCLNMAPRDARWLYFWSDPQVPPGWTMAAGVTEAPGSLVRVRSKEVPAPEIRGYARNVDAARQHTSRIE